MKDKRFFLYKGDNINVLENIKISPNIIYLDPPYNTWNETLSYSDKVKSKDWTSNFKVLLNKLNLIIQKNSTIFISIGMKELASVIICVNEIFGKSSIVSIMPRRTHSGHKTSNTIILQHDFLVVVKIGKVIFNGVDLDENSYKFKDKHFDKRGLYQLRRVDYKDFKWSKTLDAEILINNEYYYPGSVSKDEWLNRKENHKTKDWSWIWSPRKIKFALENDFIEIKDGKLFKKTYTKCSLLKENNEYFIEFLPRTKKINSLYFADKKYSSSQKKNEIELLFTYPKNLELLKDIIKLPEFSEKIILDPFGGVGTTAIAANTLKDNNIKECHIIQKSEKTEKTSAAYKQGYKDIFDLTLGNIKEYIDEKIIKVIDNIKEK